MLYCIHWIYYTVQPLHNHVIDVSTGSTQGTNTPDVAMIQYEYNIYVEAPIISHSAEVTGLPGLPPLPLVYPQYTLLRHSAAQ